MKSQKNILLILILIAYSSISFSQNLFNNLNDFPSLNDSSYKAYRNQLFNLLINAPSYKTSSIEDCNKKIVKLNFYFMLDNNGNNNFSETGDGFGGTYNGYQVANDLVNELNYKSDTNVKLTLPPNNNLPINKKNLAFALNRVLFIRNSTFNRFIDSSTTNGVFNVFRTFEPANITINNGFTNESDSVINVIIQDVEVKRIQNANGTWIFNGFGYGGLGVSWNDRLVTTAIYSYYRYIKESNQMNRLTLMHDDEGRLLEHEIYHSFGLDHTVLFNDGSWCPFHGNQDTFNCDDGFPDSETPSAWHMTHTLNAPYHPGERRDSVFNIHGHGWRSNNVMDYKVERLKALSPAQINFIHLDLANRLPRLVETYTKNNISLCTLETNKISYYGNNITINNNCSTAPAINSGTVKNFYYAQTFEINGSFEVWGQMEVIKVCDK